MANRYWVGGAGTWDAISTANWSASTGGASGATAPTSSDAAIFDANSGSGLVNTAAGASCLSFSLNNAGITVQLGANISMTSFASVSSGTLNLNNFALTADNFSSTANSVRTIAFASTGKIVCTRTANVTYGVDFYNATTTATITGTPTIDFTGNFASNNGLRAPISTYDGISFNVKAGTGTFNLGSGQRFTNVDFTGFTGSLANSTHSIYGNLTLGSGMTISSGTGVMSFLLSSGVQKFTTNGVTFNRPITVGSSTAAPVLEFQDGLTQDSSRAFTIAGGTVRIKNGATSTVGTFATSGTTQKFLESALPGSQATLSQASGTVNASNLTIKDINATGGATWNAFVTNGNVDAGNNTGWDFFTQLGKYIYTRRKNKRILL